jgi:hypothetical protein
VCVCVCVCVCVGVLLHRPRHPITSLTPDTLAHTEEEEEEEEEEE